MIPKTKPYKPDFMAPGPRVIIEEEVPSFEEASAPTVDELLEYEKEQPLLQDFVRKPRYYRSQKSLGCLYRAIDENAFLSDLQAGRRSGTAADKSVLRPIWAYVTSQTQIIQWDHLKDWAKGAKEQ